MTNNLVNTLYEESQDNPDSLLWQAAQKLEKAESRVAEMTERLKYANKALAVHQGEHSYWVLDTDSILNSCGASEAWLLRKQAEAVEETAMQFPESPFVDCDNVRADILEDAQRLRQQADEAENE